MPEYRIIKFKAHAGDLEDGELQDFDVVDECYMDGYIIADRLMEDVPLKITLSNDKTQVIVTGFPDFINGDHYADYAAETAIHDDSLHSTSEMTDDFCVIQTKTAKGWAFPWDQ